MPNHITNILKVNGTDKAVKAVFDSIKGEETLFDFNKIVPIPRIIQDRNLICIQKWGTKWNAYDTEMIDDYSIIFLTAWAGVPKLIQKLSIFHPEVEFEYIFADEDVSYNTGQGTIKNGVMDMSYPEGGSNEAFEIYFATHEWARDYYEFVNGEWRYKEDGL